MANPYSWLNEAIEPRFLAKINNAERNDQWNAARAKRNRQGRVPRGKQKEYNVD
jgi:hypothetical protein